MLLVSACGSAENRSGPSAAFSSGVPAERVSLAVTLPAPTGPERPMTALTLDRNRGLLLDGEKSFTGIAVDRAASGKLMASTTYANGKKHGLRQQWYADGSLSFESHYQEGRLHGTSRSWWKNGKLRSESQLIHGVADGEQRQWYQTGALFKQLNLVRGHEAGMQRAYRPNGVLYANYEVRNGRTYGLKRANLCFSIENGAVAYE